MKENVIIVNCKVPSEAYQILSMLRHDLDNESFAISQAAVVKKEAGHLSLEDGFIDGDQTEERGWTGGLIGSLVGILAGPLGVLFGGSVGSLIGDSMDLKELADKSELLGKAGEGQNRLRVKALGELVWRHINQDEMLIPIVLYNWADNASTPSFKESTSENITVGSFICTTGHANHAIVLGLALEDGKPTDDLLARLAVAERYVTDEPNATLILTGGNPDASGKTEAAAMRELLLQLGVPGERMILEDKAETTKENFRNTAKRVNPDDPIVLISSNYHMDRAVQTARSAGFAHIQRLPARSSIALFGANVMWEAILEINELTLRQ